MTSKLIAICLLLIFVFTGSASAISDVGFGGGSMFIMEKGKHPSFGYLIKGRFPWGVNSKSISSTTNASGVVVSDTTVTFEVLTEAITVYSNFKFDKYQELEGELIVTKVRKSLGVLSSYFEAGVTLWHLRATSEESTIKDGVADGYYVGYNIQPISGLQLNTGGHIIPRNGEASTFAVQFDFSLIF